MKLRFQIPNNLKTLWDKVNWYIKILEKEIDNLLFENEKLALQNKKFRKENKELNLQNKSLQNENQTLKLLLSDIYKELNKEPKVIEKIIEKEKVIEKPIYIEKDCKEKNLNKTQTKTLLKNIKDRIEQKLENFETVA